MTEVTAQLVLATQRFAAQVALDAELAAAAKRFKSQRLEAQLALDAQQAWELDQEKHLGLTPPHKQPSGSAHRKKARANAAWKKGQEARAWRLSQERYAPLASAKWRS